MTNWWLIGLLALFTWGWSMTMATDDDTPMWAKTVALFIVGGLMYMAGVFTELWGVYR